MMIVVKPQLGALVVLVTALMVWHPRAALADHPGSPAISVQPFDGENGEALRREIVRLVRARGYRTVTSIPRVDGTAQYLLLARDHRLTAFVTGDLETRKRGGKATSQTITFLIWDGSTGSVLGRWSTKARPRQLPRAVTRGFWKQLGAALDTAHPPPLPLDEDPPPPMYIDASASNR